MHVQARLTVVASPAGLEAMLTRISAPTDGTPPINIEGVSGGPVETGGEFVFSFDHDRVDDVVRLLGDYKHLEIIQGDFARRNDAAHAVASDAELHVRVLDGNAPGTLLAAIQGASAANLGNHRLIRHVVIGQETQPDHRFYVQITFQEVKH